MAEITAMMQRILAHQVQQTDLLNKLVQRQEANANQNNGWKQQHAHLSKRCQSAAGRAGELMNNLVESMVSDLEQLEIDEWDSGGFAVTEFIDRYGQKLQQLNIMLATLSHLGTP